jgi:hypothetical protein
MLECGHQLRNQSSLESRDHNDNTHTVETEATVTTASGWQTLEFNFANQATELLH